MFLETLKHITKAFFVVLAVLGLTFAFQSPSYAACVPACTGDSVCAQRPDNCPNYKLGDWALLVVTTNPPEPNESVTLDRIFRPLSGPPQFIQQKEIGKTNVNGSFTNYVLLPQDPSLVGGYSDTYYVRGVKGNSIFFSIAP